MEKYLLKLILLKKKTNNWCHDFWNKSSKCRDFWDDLTNGDGDII